MKIVAKLYSCYPCGEGNIESFRIPAFAGMIFLPSLAIIKGIPIRRNWRDFLKTSISLSLLLTSSLSALPISEVAYEVIPLSGRNAGPRNPYNYLIEEQQQRLTQRARRTRIGQNPALQITVTSSSTFDEENHVFLRRRRSLAFIGNRPVKCIYSGISKEIIVGETEIQRR